MLKKVTALLSAAAVTLGCLGMTGYAAEQTTGTKWEVVANTGFEGSKQGLAPTGHGWNAVNTGDIVAINPDGWYTLNLGTNFDSNVSWSNALNSNVLNVKLEKGAAYRDRVVFIRGNNTGLVKPYFFNENRKYRVSFDAAVGGDVAPNGVNINLYVTNQPNGNCQHTQNTNCVQQEIGTRLVDVQTTSKFEKGDFKRLTYEFTATSPADDRGLMIELKFPGSKPTTNNIIMQIDNLLIEKGTDVAGEDFRNRTTFESSFETDPKISVARKAGEVSNIWWAQGQTIDGYSHPLVIERVCKDGDNTGFIIKSDRFNFTDADLGKVVTVKFCAAPYGFEPDTAKIVPEDCRVAVSAVMSGSEPSHTQLGYAVGSNVGGDLSKAKFTEFTYSFVVTKKNMNMNQIEVRFDVSPFVKKFKDGVNQLTGDNLLRIAVDNVRIYNENPHVFATADSSVMIYGPETVNMNEYLLGVYNADGMLTNVFKRGLNKFTTYVAGMKTIKAFPFDESNLTPKTNTVLTKGF